MSQFVELRSEQARQLLDVEQVFAAYRAARADYDRRFTGAMSWKSIKGADYLYRKEGAIWKSLGARGPASEATHRAFHEGRERLQGQMTGLAARLDEMAPVNRGFGLGRVPVIAARILRALDRAKLMGNAVGVVGTHALYAYERMAGVFVASGYLATSDVDLLFDARAGLRLLATDTIANGITGLLRKIDRSFAPTQAGSFRAVNRDGFMVDLIQPLPKNRMAVSARSRVGRADDDLVAVEIEGLSWLVNSPKIDTVVLDARGYPVLLATPDPRAFALHKLWLSERIDRDPLKRKRDAAQGRLVTDLLSRHLPHMGFDDPTLEALPKALRALAIPKAEKNPTGFADLHVEPDW